MFGFLKKKLKQAVDAFSHKATVDEVVEDELTPEEQTALVQEEVQTLVVEEPELSFVEEELIATADNVVDIVDEPAQFIDGPESLLEDELEDALVSQKDEVESEVLVRGDSPFQVIDDSHVQVQEQATSFDEPFTDAPEVVFEKQLEQAVREDIPVVKTAVREELLEQHIQDATKKQKGFFSKLKERIVKFQLTEESFEEIFWDVELALLENSVAVEVIETIKRDLHDQLTKENVTRKSVEQVLLETLKKSLASILDCPPRDLLAEVNEKQPYVICVVGVNGSGKTTTLAKLIRYFQQQNKSVVVAASDTFRAAAIQQLEEHTTKLGVRLIKHDYHADPAAVAFDAVKHATAKHIDVVLIDTAGRLQSNANLMDELKKVVRVTDPDFKLFIGESITGNDCVEQAVAFNEAVGIDGIVLSKADVDEKGGAALSVSFMTGKPILFLGVGQTYDDLIPYDKEQILSSLGF